MFLKNGWLLALLSLALPAPAQTATSNRAPNASEQSAALAAIREYATNHTQSLPDYVCSQTTRQTISPDAADPNGPQPRQTNVIEAEIGYVNHREMEKLTTINGKPAASADPKDLPESFSRGEFGTLLLRIFEPQTSTEFRWDRWVTRDKRRMYVFSYRVPKSKGYVIQEGKRTTVVAFKGLVYADAETNAVMRIEMQGIDFPASSSYQSLTLKLNYKLTKVAEQEFVLPSDFELNSRQSGGTTEVDAEYRNYRRFSADATIQFSDINSGR